MAKHVIVKYARLISLKGVAVALAAELLLPLGVGAQSVVGPRFEVASVRRSATGGIAQFVRYEGQTLTIRNSTFRELLRHAYRAYFPGEIVGGPNWVDQQRFDVIAKTTTAGAPAFAMLRGLLSERFALKTHEESRDVPVYRLIVTQADRRLGPKLVRSTTDCAGNGRPPSKGGCGHSENVGRFFGIRVPVAQLAASLAFQVERRVIDDTGLQGEFDVDLTWQPDTGAGPESPGSQGNAAPSLTTAVQEQLGLKLQPGNAMVRVLVIDSVERPEEN